LNSPGTHFRGALHACCATGDLAAFLHALELSPTVRLGLAHHVVVIIGLASCTNKEGGTEQGRRTCSKFFDLGYIFGKRSGVDESLLVESARGETVEVT